MGIKSSEYRLLSYVRDNPGIEDDILKTLNLSHLRVGWGPYMRRTYSNIVKNDLMTKYEGKCFLTEEGKEELERYEKFHMPGKRGIIEHKHEIERIRPALAN